MVHSYKLYHYQLTELIVERLEPAQAFPLLTQLVGNGTTCTSAPSAANNFCLPTLSVALNSTMQTTTNSLQIDTSALALYAQGTYHVSDDFRITAGLRYSSNANQQ